MDAHHDDLTQARDSLHNDAQMPTRLTPNGGVCIWCKDAIVTPVYGAFTCEPCGRFGVLLERALKTTGVDDLAAFRHLVAAIAAR